MILSIRLDRSITPGSKSNRLQDCHLLYLRVRNGVMVQVMVGWRAGDRVGLGQMSLKGSCLLATNLSLLTNSILSYQRFYFDVTTKKLYYLIIRVRVVCVMYIRCRIFPLEYCRVLIDLTDLQRP